MKIIISEISYKKLINEINSELKSEMEIIYKSSDLLCIIPKSQRISNILGNKTAWCQTQRSGFDIWSKVGLLFRFIFKNGRKIRMTYAFKDSKFQNHQKDYHWSNETGYHVLNGDGNPFIPETGTRIRDMEKDIIDLINLIPNECKEKVIEVINQNRKRFDYCRDNTIYITNKKKRNYQLIRNMEQKYKDIFEKLSLSRDLYVRINLDQNFNFIIVYAMERTEPTKELTFKNINKMEETLLDIFKQMGQL